MHILSKGVNIRKPELMLLPQFFNPVFFPTGTKPKRSYILYLSIKCGCQLLFNFGMKQFEFLLRLSREP